MGSFLQSVAASTLGLSLLLTGSNASLIKRQAPSPPATLPDGWSYKGCYTDAVGQRSLQDSTFSDSTQSAAECINYCASAGYKLAGTEYSDECYCGNAISSPGGLAPNGDGCNMECSGSSGEACGGPNRLSVYERLATASAQSSGIVIDDGTEFIWESLGCYSDLTYARILSTGVSVQGGSQNNSAQSCTTECKSQNFTYAGTEYASECYCGDTLDNDHTPVDSGCTMQCAGNNKQFCGGPNRINVYVHMQRPKTTSSSSSTPAPSSSPSPTPAPGSAGSSAQETTSSVSDASVTVLAATLSQNATSSASPTPSSKVGWFYEGCYVDGPGPRTLPNGVGVQGGMTNQKCRDACQAAGYVLAGTEYAGECWCGNTLQGVGAPASDGEAQCNMACNGNQTEICGGPNRLSFFHYYKGNELPVSSTTGVISSSTAAPAPTGLPTGFTYKGCYVDGPGYRVMQNQQPDNQQMTVASCATVCAGLGYTVAGMEYHTQCFCDNQLRMNASIASNDNECNTPCGGNSAQMCGGGDRLTVYSSQDVLKITQKPAPTPKVGNWTYQGCATSNGGQWDKPLPWKLFNDTGNSPEWCLSKCQAYGYMAAGMEYGSECYCGDVDHMVEKGSVPAPETDCNTPCPGDEEAICGQGNRLTWYMYTEGDPLYVFHYPQGNDAGRYEFLVGGPVIPLISVPLINGKVSFLEKSGTNLNGTGAYELDPSIDGGHDIFHSIREVTGLKTDVFCAASVTMPDRSGRILNIGGWSGDSLYGVRLYTPNGQLGVNSTSEWQENYEELRLQTTRWYPTAMVMANGSVLVVGGENGSNGPSVPNMEILPRVGPLVFAQYLLDTDPNNLYPFLAVLPSGGIFIQYYNEARILDEQSLATIKILPKVPAAVNDENGGRTYPLEGTMVLLPQKYPYTDNLEVLVCGGGGSGWGLDNCVSTQPDAANPEWTIERMPSRRVLSCMVTLPDGTYMIMNGAEQGVAGFGLADMSNLNALLYDSRLPKHQRISILGNTTIARMYHSEAVLLDDGRVLVSGSDPEDGKHPQEYRYEVYLPPYLTSGKPRPAFTVANNDWTNGGQYQFTVTAGSANVRVSILGSEASTHGNSMGARILEPQFSCASFPTCTVVAPPGPHIAPPGWYRMFILDDDIPSAASWVRIGGDPAGLGNWPDFEDFHPLPGVGPL